MDVDGRGQIQSGDKKNLHKELDELWLIWIPRELILIDGESLSFKNRVMFYLGNGKYN